MSKGLIVMSAKPYHKGHDLLVRLASKDSEGVVVFVSMADRKRKNEFVISGSVMMEIWQDYLLKILPKNVEVKFCGNPVKDMIEYIESKPYEDFVVYSDITDSNAYKHKFLPKSNMHFLCVDRKSTHNTSGTKIRRMLSAQDCRSFCLNMSDFLSQKEKIEIYERLLRV